MRSIALYIDNDQKNSQQNTEENDVKEELHINIWKVQQGSLIPKPKLYIDFGIMTTFKTKKMYLYLPFQIVGRPIDLGKKLQENREMLCTVFNDNLMSETCENNCYSDVKASQGNEFYLFQLGSENIKVEKWDEEGEKDGTFLTILREGWYDNSHNEKNEEAKVYMRFRIEVKDIKEIVYSEFVSNDLLQAAFSKIDLYDIRINETREIHPKIREKMSNEAYKLCTFSKIHLFYMADSREKVENESSLKSDSRILEEGKWSYYEPKNDLMQSIFLAHHWKKGKEGENNIESFSLFFSTIYPRIHWCHLIAFLSVIILSGWVGGMLEFDFSKINNKWDTWISPIIITILIVFLIVYILISNFGCKIKIFRK